MRILKDLKKARVKGSFAQDLSIVVSGRFFVVALGFLLTPVLSRIYDPEAYGMFSFFNSLVMNLTLIGTMRLPLAFVIPRSTRGFRDLAQVTSWILLVFSLFVTFFFFLFGREVFSAFGIHKFKGLEFLIGVGCIVYGIPMVLGSWNIRKKAFRKTTPIGIFSNLNIKVFNVLYGYLQKGIYLGLIYGELWGRSIRGIALSLILRRELPILWRDFSIHKIGRVLNEFKRYPIYILPSAWIDLFLLQLPIFYLIYFHGTGIAGAFTMVTSLLNIPVRVLGESTMPVVLEKTSRYREAKEKEKGTLRELMVQLSGKLLFLPFLLFPVLIFWGKPMLTWFLGKNWGNAGELIAFIGVMFLLKGAIASFKQVLNVFDKQSFQFKINLLRLLIGGSVLIVGYFRFPDIPKFSLLGFALAMFLIDLVYLFLIFREVGGGFTRVFLFNLLIFIFSFLFCWGIAYFIRSDLFLFIPWRGP